MNSRKYNRTYHYPFSPGTTSDDRINHTYWEDLQKIIKVGHTEKLDGENTCMNDIGIFARSHAAPTIHPWADHLKSKYSLIKNDLVNANIEIFGENLYAQHSIIYPRLSSYFYMFAVRCLDMWLSWDEVKWYAEFFEFPTAPELGEIRPTDVDEETYKNLVLMLVNEPSIFGSLDTHTGEICTREGVVTRNLEEYPVDEFPHNVFKYVRKGHVKTNEHWTRNWKRAPLIWEEKQWPKNL